jgi:hypothetical protein
LEVQVAVTAGAAGAPGLSAADRWTAYRVTLEEQLHAATVRASCMSVSYLCLPH